MTWTPGVGAVIGVIAKAPVWGQVKTRLCPPLDPGEAAEVAAALLADTLSAARATGQDLCCVHAGPAWAVLPYTDGTPLLQQRGAGLAERLAAAQEDLHAAGHERVVLLGADCPTVDAAYLNAVLTRLDGVDVVLGAAADGGYTLIASKAPEPVLFAVEMSTARVLNETRARAEAAGLTVACLPARHDLDDIEDFAAALASGQLDHAPRTRAIAQRLAALTARQPHASRPRV